MVTAFEPVQPWASVTSTEYVVVATGVTSGFDAVTLLTPMVGDHE